MVQIRRAVAQRIDRGPRTDWLSPENSGASLAVHLLARFNAQAVRRSILTRCLRQPHPQQKQE